MDDDKIRDRLRLAYGFAAKSLDPSTQNGAVLFSADDVWIGSGWNRIVPESCCTPERLADKPQKYAFTTHAEQDAIFDAIRQGRNTVGSTLYAGWLACDMCGKTIVGCGVTRVVRHSIPQHAERPDWAKSIAAADEMFRAAGVSVTEYVGKLGVKFRFNGQEIEV
jgi:dCMP deaminase